MVKKNYTGNKKSQFDSFFAINKKLMKSLYLIIIFNKYSIVYLSEKRYTMYCIIIDSNINLHKSNYKNIHSLSSIKVKIKSEV